MRLTNYWMLIIWLFIVGIVAYFFNVKREEPVEGKWVVRWKPLAAYILSVPYVIWAGWRVGFGDTEQYRSTFREMPSNLGQIIKYMESVEKGHGFRLLELLFKCLISTSDIAFFTFIAIIQMICLVYIYRKYSENYWLTFFFFVASTDYLSWMHNGIRQFLAASILLLCLPLIARKRYFPAVIIVIIAAFIHVTALIFLPFIFIANGRMFNARTVVFIAAVIIAILYTDRITGFLTVVLQDTAYEGDIDILKNDNGTNIIRALFYSIPCIMSFVSRPYIDEADNAIMNVCANMSLITAGFYLFSVFSSGILMGAIPIYFSLSNYILIPWMLKECFTRETGSFLEKIFIIVYIVFFWYQCGQTWGVL